MSEDHAFHLAIGQSPAELSSVAERLDWLLSILPTVSENGADLLLLPELFATGYNIGEEVAARAQPAGGPIAQAISNMAKSHGVAIHYGFAEAGEGRIYNAAQCFGPDGSRLGGHRKVAIPPGFEREHFTPGESCKLFTYRRMNIATLICYDAEFPEAARHVAAMGAHLILVPTALGQQWGWVAQHMVPTRAYENGVYLAYANGAGVERGMQYLGQSLIAAPDGVEVVRAGSGVEVIFGTLHLNRVAAAQARLPYLTDRVHFKADFPEG